MASVTVENREVRHLNVGVYLQVLNTAVGIFHGATLPDISTHARIEPFCVEFQVTYLERIVRHDFVVLVGPQGAVHAPAGRILLGTVHQQSAGDFTVEDFKVIRLHSAYVWQL